MTNCAKLRKNDCTPPCVWIHGLGCRNYNYIMKKASKIEGKSSPPAKQPSPPAKQPSPSAKQPSPPAKQPSPPAKQPSPPAKQPSPPANQIPSDYILLPDGVNYGVLGVIGDGAFGCVLQPAISDPSQIKKVIVPYTQQANDDISKIYKFGEKDFATELKLLQDIDKIDPGAVFTTKFKGACQISGKSFESNKSVQNCLRKFKNLDNKTFYQIILENGGTTVNSNKTPITYVKFLQLFQQFLKGMLIFQAKNKVHLDIKPPNVLINQNKISLIDFSLTSDASDVYKYENYQVLSYMYPYYPPEFYIASSVLVYLHSHATEPNAFQYISKGLYKRLENDKYFESKYMKEKADRYKKGIKKFIKQLKEFTNVNDVFNVEMALKADVFALSYIISALSDVIIYTNQKQKKFVEKLCTKCSEPNPYDRVSMQELYDIVSTEHNIHVRSP